MTKKLILMGRAGSGKDYLAAKLREQGMTIIRSCTNRPKRFDAEDTHVSLTESEINAIADEQKLCKTVVNGFEYFFTEKMFTENDGCILDIPGFYEISKRFPKEEFLLVYIIPTDDSLRKQKISTRGSHKNESMKLREEEESRAFSTFETLNDLPENVEKITIYNDYKEGAMKGAAMMIPHLLTF